jgi:folate-binding protein YgfZ
VPSGYGDLEEEYRQLRDGAALVDRSHLDRLVLTGPDRHRFLNGLVTCEVAHLAPGRSVYGFFTDLKGRVLSDVTVLSVGDELWLELPPGCGGAMADHMARYKIADRVEILARQDRLPLTLFGPGREAPLSTLPDGGDWTVQVGREPGNGEEVMVDRRPLGGLDATTLWVTPAVAERIARFLLAAPAVGPVGLDAVEVWRVERGVPRFGADFGPDCFPQETGLVEEAVSFSKGCYLGQEVVARIHYRGQVQRTLVGLLFSGEQAPPQGSEVVLEGRPVGTVGSAVRSIALARPAGLAVVHRRAAEPGTRLEVATGGEAEVTPLPLVEDGA